MQHTAREAHRNVVRQVYEEALNQGKLAILDELFDPHFVDHSTANQPPGTAGVRHYFMQVRSAFPDIHVTIDELIVEGASVAVRTTWRGTHQAIYEGIAPTGKRVTRTMIQIFHLADGKIREEWNEGKRLLE